MPPVPLETIRGVKSGPNDHGCSRGQGDPASTSGMAALAVPGPFGRDYGEDEELGTRGWGRGCRGETDRYKESGSNHEPDRIA